MKVKVGDKLICRKPKYRFYQKDPEPGFIDGKVYEVLRIPIGVVPYCGVVSESLIIRDDKNSIRFLNYNEILPDSNLGKIFLTIKQERKLKLQKLQKLYI